MRPPNGNRLQAIPRPAALSVLLLFSLSLAPVQSAPEPGPPGGPGEPPVIPVGEDAFLRWERWPYLRLGVRAVMRSTFDRTGGNHFADSSHYIRQRDDGPCVVLDETGPGILWFVRHNHWHGSPWHYTVDGRETIVTESSTLDPTRPVPGSVFRPASAFPPWLTWTWSVTKGADLSWVPIPFERHLELAYGRTRYGTGYCILWKLSPGMRHLSRPLESWTPDRSPSPAVVDLLKRSGTDIAPRGDGVRSWTGTLSLRPFEASTVLHLRDTALTLRRLAFTVPGEGAEALAAARLRVTWDERRHPAIDAPLGLFFATGSLRRNSDSDFIVKSFPMTVRRTDETCHFATYFPMPFQRSARIALEESTGQSLAGIRWEVRAVEYRDPANHVGWFHATHRDFARPDPGRSLVLLDTREAEGGGDWCGHIVGTTYIFTRTNTLNTLEGDPRFFLDDSLFPQGQGTGSEEWGGGGDYWGGRTMTLPFAGHPVGVPPGAAREEIDRLHSAYRFLLSDLIPFGKNARFVLEHGGNNTSREHYETVVYWYGLDRPGLVLTDELDIGDTADEERHAYASPEASEVVELASRFELGVDHVPLEGSPDGRVEIFPPVADDGRRTRGASEFTVRLRADNIGVLLRRRLDLAYPDQRARVSVRNREDSGWEEAGIWYTAGSNTVLFADPLARPREELQVHPELAPPAHVVETSNRRWKEDEFLIARELTEGREEVRLRLEFQPVGKPLFPGRPVAEEAWTEFRYRAYCVVVP